MEDEIGLCYVYRDWKQRAFMKFEPRDILEGFANDKLTQRGRRAIKRKAYDPFSFSKALATNSTTNPLVPGQLTPLYFEGCVLGEGILIISVGFATRYRSIESSLY